MLCIIRLAALFQHTYATGTGDCLFGSACVWSDLEIHGAAYDPLVIMTKAKSTQAGLNKGYQGDIGDCWLYISFDECFKKGISEYKKVLNCTQSYKKENIKVLAKFFENNEEDFLNVMSSSIDVIDGITYPHMKIIDMAFWQIGRIKVDNNIQS